MSANRIEAVAFDCYGTLVDFDDAGFERAYGRICAEQGLPIDGKTFYDKWMEIWRRPAQAGAVGSQSVVANRPAALSEPEPEVAHEGLAAIRVAGAAARRLDGEPPPFRPYREEWPEHFAACFEELGVRGDAERASERLRQLLSEAQAYSESRRVVEMLTRRLPIALMSNADNDFLLPCLSRNGLAFPVVISSEDVGAYKPHVSIFNTLSESIGVPLPNILYVGDSRAADVAGGKNAGLRVAWVNRGRVSFHPPSGERRHAEPDYDIETLDRLIEIIDGRP
jgi:2-haloalkanoic acid dehalogenase type II